MLNLRTGITNENNAKNDFVYSGRIITIVILIAFPEIILPYNCFIRGIGADLL